MLISTIDSSQRCHIIGYAVADKEDKNTHKHAIMCLKDGIDRLVKERMMKQLGI